MRSEATADRSKSSEESFGGMRQIKSQPGKILKDTKKSKK